MLIEETDLCMPHEQTGLKRIIKASGCSLSGLKSWIVVLFLD
jgi:hypothetical protein